MRVHTITTGLLASLLLALPAASQPHEKRLTLAQAVAAAERFIKINGYTDHAPTSDRSKLTFESIEWEKDDLSRMLALRHNTLERHAYSYAAHGYAGQPGWTVVFRYKKQGDAGEPYGRGVVMDPYGHHLRVEHVDAFADRFARLRPASRRRRG